MAIRTPVFMSRFSCLEKVALNMSAIVWSSSGVPFSEVLRVFGLLL